MFSILYRAAEPDILYTEIQECTGLRHDGIGLRGIRLARSRELFSDFIAGYQDSAVYNCPAGAVTESQYSSDYQNLAAAAEVRGVDTVECYLRYRFRIQQ